MPDYLAEFTVATLSGIVSGFVVTSVPLAQWARRLWQRRRSDPIIAENDAVGRPPAPPLIVQDLRGSIDNGRQTIIDNMSISVNMVDAKPTAPTTDQQWIVLVLGFAAIGIFATHRDLVFFFAVGAMLGLLLTAVLAVRRARRLNVWDRQDLAIAGGVLLVTLGTCWTWVAVFTATHNGSTLGELGRRALASGATMPMQSGFVGEIQSLLNPVIAFIELAATTDQFMFAMSLTGAVALSFVSMHVAWLRLNDWYTFLGFWYGKDTERARRRAQRHIDREGSDIWRFVIVTGITVFFASGLFVHIADAAFAHAITPHR